MRFLSRFSFRIKTSKRECLSGAWRFLRGVELIIRSMDQIRLPQIQTLFRHQIGEADKAKSETDNRQFDPRRGIGEIGYRQRRLINHFQRHDLASYDQIVTHEENSGHRR